MHVDHLAVGAEVAADLLLRRLPVEVAHVDLVLRGWQAVGGHGRHAMATGKFSSPMPEDSRNAEEEISRRRRSSLAAWSLTNARPFMPPELGVLVNSQPIDLKRSHASYTSGTVMPRWPKPPRTFWPSCAPTESLLPVLYTLPSSFSLP